jgi:hypothetical protein
MKDAQLAPSEDSLTKECGWKDGDRGGPAQTKKPLIRKRKNRLDTYRPSHGRTWLGSLFGDTLNRLISTSEKAG